MESQEITVTDVKMIEQHLESLKEIDEDWYWSLWKVSRKTRNYMHELKLIFEEDTGADSGMKLCLWWWISHCAIEASCRDATEMDKEYIRFQLEPMYEELRRSLDI